MLVELAVIVAAYARGAAREPSTKIVNRSRTRTARPNCHLEIKQSRLPTYRSTRVGSTVSSVPATDEFLSDAETVRKLRTKCRLFALHIQSRSRRARQF